MSRHREQTDRNNRRRIRRDVCKHAKRITTTFTKRAFTRVFGCGERSIKRKLPLSLVYHTFTPFYSSQIVITAKIILAYAGDFHIVAITHALDSARSALVSWALIREQRKVAETVARDRTLE
ncbi:hypothetical protein HK104_007802, partial [Borealophlyctis nickersoniae]